MILLTGATGFIGSHLIRRLVSFSPVRCLVRPESISKLQSLPSTEVIPYDFSSDKPLEEKLRGVDCVIHLSALLRKKSPAEIRKVNVDGTRRLVDASKKQGVRHFIFVSTENALREDLRDAYAESKREAESIVRGIENHLILRPCFVYGDGDEHGLGRLIRLTEKNYFVPLFGGLKNRIQPVYIDDMAEYLIRAVQKNLGGEYVIAGPEAIDLNTFVKRALRIRGSKKILVPVPYFFLHIAAMAGDTFSRSSGWGTAQLRNIYEGRTYSIEKTIEAFGFRPRDLETGLKDWFKK